jgi:hypothetical protein
MADSSDGIVQLCKCQACVLRTNVFSMSSVAICLRSSSRFVEICCEISARVVEYIPNSAQHCNFPEGT